MKLRVLLLIAVVSFVVGRHSHAAEAIEPKLAGLDAYMEQLVKDWNAPGVAVGVVVKDKLVYAKGFGYRDYGKKLPMTAKTLIPIGSNTKLFTSVAAGLLVEEGKLGWDEPVRKFVPGIQFYNDDLNNTVSVRDMLAHRTGITRHDTIWYKADYNSKELYERLKYLEPNQPLRHFFLYNNMMYAGIGHIIHLLSGKTWDEFTRKRLLQPLGMKRTVFTIDDMLKNPDHGVGYKERRDSFELYEAPYYRLQGGVAPAGAIISNVEEMSNWVIALMNDGKFAGKTVIPPNVLKETLRPAIAVPNTGLEARGYTENLNPIYGMGRFTSSYRGHVLTSHGGDINNFHAQVSTMPYEGFGVIVLVIGDHAQPLYNTVTFNVYERLLGLDETPWSKRLLEIRLKGKEAGKQARAKAGGDRVAGTQPSHPLADFAGEFEHPAYGVLTIGQKESGLTFDFHHIRMPLGHFHYDRFDTPDDELDGKWTVNFGTNAQGEVDKVLMSLDQAEVVFARRVPAALSSPATLKQYAGPYETATGSKFEIVLREDGILGAAYPGRPFQALVPWKPHRFKVKEFSDVQVEFVVEGGKVTAMKHIDPSGEYVSKRR
jgi:CubicO group peptidase (beta-lactamase class C family)